jgi:asparagine synthase (glutamine-hydrolysing)
MAAGVEARVPFLDHSLVEWANALPPAVKLPRGERKGLLKRIGEQWLPNRIVYREKVGFTMPLGEWLRPRGALGSRVERLRDPHSKLREVLNGRAIDRLIEQHNRGTADHGDILWTLIALDAWAAVFLQESIQRVHLPGALTGRHMSRQGSL